MKQLLIITLLLPLYSCNRVKIVQDVDNASVLDGTCYVSTHIYTYNFIGYTQSMEYWKQVEVLSEKTDSVKKAEYIKALPVYAKAVKFLKEAEQ